MERKIILKPTDYVAFKDGRIDYSFSGEMQYSDGEKLNRMSENELEKECQNRWMAFKQFPTPSNYSKLSLAQDLAKAKGFNVTFNSKNEYSNSHNAQREF